MTLYVLFAKIYALKAETWGTVSDWVMVLLTIIGLLSLIFGYRQYIESLMPVFSINVVVGTREDHGNNIYRYRVKITFTCHSNQATSVFFRFNHDLHNASQLGMPVNVVSSIMPGSIQVYEHFIDESQLHGTARIFFTDRFGYQRYYQEVTIHCTVQSQNNNISKPVKTGVYPLN